MGGTTKLSIFPDFALKQLSSPGWLCPLGDSQPCLRTLRLSQLSVQGAFGIKQAGTSDGSCTGYTARADLTTENWSAQNIHRARPFCLGFRSPQAKKWLPSFRGSLSTAPGGGRTSNPWRPSSGMGRRGVWVSRKDRISAQSHVRAAVSASWWGPDYPSVKSFS